MIVGYAELPASARRATGSAAWLEVLEQVMLKPFAKRCHVRLAQHAVMVARYSFNCQVRGNIAPAGFTDLPEFSGSQQDGSTFEHGELRLGERLDLGPAYLCQSADLIDAKRVGNSRSVGN